MTHCTPAAVRRFVTRRVHEATDIIRMAGRQTCRTTAWRSRFGPYLSMARGTRRGSYIQVALQGIAMASRTPTAIWRLVTRRMEKATDIICMIGRRSTATTAGRSGFRPYLAMTCRTGRRSHTQITFQSIAVARRTPMRIRCLFTSRMQKSGNIVGVIAGRITTTSTTRRRRFGPHLSMTRST